MTKRPWLGLAALLAVVMLGVMALWFGPGAEPLYKGQPLHFWLQGYSPTARLHSNDPGPGPTRGEADDAMRAVGTNAIPDLLRMLVYRQPPLIPPLWAIGRRLHIVKGQPAAPYDRNLEAQTAFWKLGDTAAGAVPDLIRMYDAHPDPSSRASILFVFRWIGPKAKEAIPVLLRAMTNASEDVRLNAAGALGKIHADAARAVPALIIGLSDPSTMVRQNAILGLRQFGAEARPAVPALLQLLRDEKYDPATAAAPPKNPLDPISLFGGVSRPPGVVKQMSGLLHLSDPADLAASALWAIDADAADKAHLKQPR